MSEFEKGIHQMFDHIWECEIDHPIFQDTVGELMSAVIQLYESTKPTIDLVRCAECRWSRPRTLKGETGYRCVFYRTYKAETGYCDIGEREGE